MASKDHPFGRQAEFELRDGVPDYHKIARELARLGAEAANRAAVTGNSRYDRLADTLTARAGAMLADLRQRGKLEP